MVLFLAPSKQRLRELAGLWSRVAPGEKAQALAQALSGGEALAPERSFLLRALRELRKRQARVFDSDNARAAYDALPGKVTIYRGTVAAEAHGYGVSWTLDQDRARFFASFHNRFGDRSSPAVILQVNVPKKTIRGMLVERSESEVLMLPETFRRNKPIELLA